MPTASSRKHPITDFGYQTTGADFRVLTTGPDFQVRHAAPPFRNLSKEFLAHEMKRDYRKEAVCFLVIVGLSVWPIGMMVQALSLLK